MTTAPSLNVRVEQLLLAIGVHGGSVVFDHRETLRELHRRDPLRFDQVCAELRRFDTPRSEVMALVGDVGDPPPPNSTEHCIKVNGSGNNGRVAEHNWRDGMISARALCTMTFEPMKFIVPKIIPEGLTILAGRPKIGKSWLVLLLGLVLSNGVAAFGLDYGTTRPIKGSVLYLGLEDGKRRLQSRMTKLIGVRPENWPEELYLKTEWRRLDQGGLNDIRAWHRSVKDRGGNPILVVIDTLVKVRAPGSSKHTPYQNDHDALAGLQKLAEELSIAIVLNHHDRKMDADDVFDTVSGTLGLTGAVDTILVLTKKAGVVTLHVRGRDIEEEVSLAMRFNKEDGRWSVVGEAAEVQRSEVRARVLAALASAPPEGLKVQAIIAEAGIRSRDAADQLLLRMTRDGDVERPSRGKYSLPRPSASDASESHKHGQAVDKMGQQSPSEVSDASDAASDVSPKNAPAFGPPDDSFLNLELRR
jgi:hypothetical protein